MHSWLHGSRSEAFGVRSDGELMAAYVAGDPQAFHEIFVRYAPLLRRVASSRLMQAADAADVVQQTFLQLHRARLDYRPDAPLRPYIMTICVNLCREHHRKRARRREDDRPATFEALQPSAPVQEQQHQTTQEAARLHAALAQLPDAQREAIVLHWLADMPFPDVAAALGVTVGAAKVRAHRGYEALRKILWAVT